MIDVFNHILPPGFVAAARRLSPKLPLMFDRACQIPAMASLEARFRVMDRFDGYRQILSLSSPLVEVLAPDNAAELARIGNDEMAALTARWPERFPGFIASLPANDAAAAAREARRAVGELGAVGVQLYTNHQGRPLDHPDILPLFGLLAELGRPVWVHPIRAMTTPDYPGESYSKYDLWWALGWPHETAVAMGRLVFAGVFDRWPALAVITHHVGGAMPMYAGRIEHGLQLLGTRNPPELGEAVRTSLQEPPLQALRRFYADTASFGSRAALDCGRAFFGTDRLLFATDMPFDPEQGPGFIRETLRALDEMELEPGERAAILEGNARALLRLGPA